MQTTAPREDSSGNRHTYRSRLAYAGLPALLLVGAALLGDSAFERGAVSMSPRPLHALGAERRELHLHSGDLLDWPSDAERRCAWPNETTRQVSSTDVEQTVTKNRERLLGNGVCYVRSFVVGDLDGDRRDDVVAEIWCSMPDVGQSYQNGVAVFSNTGGRGLTLASMQELPFRVRLERICDDVLTVEVDMDEYRKDVALHFGSRYDDDASYAVNLRLRGGRLTIDTRSASSTPSPR